MVSLFWEHEGGGGKGLLLGVDGIGSHGRGVGEIDKGESYPSFRLISLFLFLPTVASRALPGVSDS